MNTETISIIIGVGIFGLTIFFSLLYRNKKIKSGKIANRKGAFYLQTHTFSSRAPFSAFVNALNQYNIGQDKITIQGNGAGGCLTFTGPGWNAQIVQEQTPLGHPYQYVFDFTGWRSTNGVPVGGISMNVLLTAIEKSFLTTDLDATVVRRAKAMKTKTNFL